MFHKFKGIATIAIIFSAFCISQPSFATGISDPLRHSTIIDCEYGNDATATPFTGTGETAYFSLKKGIEDSIQYLNANRYTDGYYQERQLKWYNIKVKGVCHYTQQDGWIIVLNFDGVSWKDWLNITSFEEGQSFGIVNQSFYLANQNAGNINFINANFLRNDVSGYYFDGFDGKDSYCWSNPGWNYNGPWVSIYNSIIYVNEWKQFSRSSPAVLHYCYGPVMAHLPGWYYIDNATITYYVGGNADLRMPVVTKDSKIIIKNTNRDWVKYDVAFNVAWHDGEGYKYGSATVMSSEIDMNGNHFKADDYATNFVNDKFVNVGNFTAGTASGVPRRNVFVNNSVQCTNNVDISSNDIAYNNLFSNGFTDTGDTDNFKRNFSGTSTNEKGVGWIYHKLTGGPINVSVNYKTLFEQLHPGQTLDEGSNPVYLVIE